MERRSLGLEILMAVAVVTTGAGARAQDSEAKPPAKAEVPAKKAPQDVKSVLLGESRASTARATEGAAKEKAKNDAPQLEEAKAESPKPEGDPAVTELRPVPPDPKEEKKAPSETGGKKAGHAPLQDVHGSVYGGAGSGSQTAGGEVGASTRSGKTHVYLGGQTGRQGAPRP
jgi:hypothetical protein